MRSPYEAVPDDTVCYRCGKELPENPVPGTLEFDGFCSKACWVLYNGYIRREFESHPEVGE